MMDSLHGMLRALSSEHGVKSDKSAPQPHHLDVFREFLSHLDRVKRQAPRPRPKTPRKAARAGKR